MSDPHAPPDFSKADQVYALRRILGMTIRLLRRHEGLSLGGLASTIGVTETHMDAIEQGETVVTQGIRNKLLLIFSDSLDKPIE